MFLPRRPFDSVSLRSGQAYLLGGPRIIGWGRKTKSPCSVSLGEREAGRQGSALHHPHHSQRGDARLHPRGPQRALGALSGGYCAAAGPDGPEGVSGSGARGASLVLSGRFHSFGWKVLGEEFAEESSLGPPPRTVDTTVFKMSAACQRTQASRFLHRGAWGRRNVRSVTLALLSPAYYASASPCVAPFHRASLRLACGRAETGGTVRHGG